MFEHLKKELNMLGYGTTGFFEHAKKNFSSITENLPDDMVEWTKKVRILNGKPFSFDNRPYLLQLYRDPAKEIHIVKPRQMELTEFALNWLLFNLTKNPTSVGLYLSDRKDHVSIFSKLRLRSRGIDQSPILQALTNNCHAVSWQPFKNGSHLWMYTAWGDFETARSIPVDFVVVDEMQSVNVEAFPVVKESLSKSIHGKLLTLGTGSLEGDHWWKKWHTGTQMEWDMIQQKWIPKNPSSKISSYHFTQYMASWLSPEIIHQKKLDYTPRRFANEVEGTWYKGLQRPLVEKELRVLFDRSIDITLAEDVDHTMPVFLGVDWGGGTQAFTVAWIWQLVNENVPRFKLLNLIKITEPSTEKQADEVINLMDKYQIDQACMDSGGGTRQVEKLAKRYGPRIFKCHYRYNAENPFEIISAENRVNVDRTWVIETIIDLIKRPEDSLNYPDGIPRIHVPAKNLEKVEWMIDHFTCIEAETSEANGKSFVKYIHGEETNDDALHAAGYAYLASLIFKGNRWAWGRL